jgi:hypothetical protein
MMLDGCGNPLAIVGIEQAPKPRPIPRHLPTGPKHSIYGPGSLHLIGLDVPDCDDIAAIFGGNAESLL